VVSNRNGTLNELVFDDNTKQQVNHIYLKPKTTYQIQWGVTLGCKQDEQKRHLISDEFMQTSEKGIYAVGRCFFTKYGADCLEYQFGYDGRCRYQQRFSKCKFYKPIIL